MNDSGGQPLGFAHDAFFYSNEEGFAGAVVPWLREGLAQGQAAVVATTRPHIELIGKELGGDAASVAFLLDDDWYVRPGRTIAGWHRTLHDLADQRFDYARVICEVRFGSSDEERRSWTRFESALNAAFAQSDSWFVCPYDQRVLADTVLSDAWRTHPTAWDPSRRANDRYVDPATLLSEIHDSTPTTDGQPVIDMPISDGLSDVRRAVRDRATQARMPQERVEELVLAVSETGANVVLHGAGQGRVILWISEDRVVCEVTDQGEGLTDPLAGYLPPDQTASRGMGLWLVRQLCDSIAIEPTEHGTTVRFSMDLERP